jgi:hypothetical protein
MTPMANDAASAIACDDQAIGDIRYNTATTAFEGCNGVAWADIRNGATATAAGLTGQVQFNSGGALAASTNFFWDNVNGGLGIGTATPSDKLDVKSGNIRLSNDSGSAFVKIDSINFVRSTYDPTGIAASVDFWRGGAGQEGILAFSTNSGWGGTGQTPTERMRIDSLGNVGIGTTVPSSQFTIVQPTTGNIWASLGESAFSDDFVIESKSSTFNTGRHIWQIRNGDGEGAAILSQSNFGNGGISIYSNLNVGANVFDAGYQLDTVIRPAVSGNSVVIRGQASPSVDIFDVQNSSFTTLLNVTAAGNVGIGTVTPGAPLDVERSSASGAISSSGTTVTGTGTTFTTTFVVGDLIMSAGQAQTIATIPGDTSLTTSAAFSPAISAGTAYTRVGAVLNSGNVGIGQTSPGTSLDVNGGVTMQPAAVTLTANNTVLATANRSYFQVTSDNTTEANRIFCFGAGTLGQVLIVEWTSSTNRGEIVSHGNCAGAAGAVTASLSYTNWAPKNTETILQLINLGGQVSVACFKAAGLTWQQRDTPIDRH